MRPQKRATSLFLSITGTLPLLHLHLHMAQGKAKARKSHIFSYFPISSDDTLFVIAQTKSRHVQANDCNTGFFFRTLTVSRVQRRTS